VSDPRTGDRIAAARAADTRQAAYFRRLLDHQRTMVEGELASHRHDLAIHRDSGDLRAVNRLRLAIHAKEADRCALERLIAVLDERLGTPR
jgi:hypothetical protein